jgi:hypothetical protein
MIPWICSFPAEQLVEHLYMLVRGGHGGGTGRDVLLYVYMYTQESCNSPGLAEPESVLD